MKIYAAALLALGTAAIQLTQTELPHEAPTCGDPPSEAEVTAATASPEAFASVIDTANSTGTSDGTITEQEVFNALYCLNEWGAISEDDAKAAYNGFQEHYGAGGSVSVADAAADIATALAEE